MKFLGIDKILEVSKTEDGGESSFYSSYMETIIRDLQKKAVDEWEIKLKSFLKENLKEFGYEFDSDADFVSFCKTRITLLDFVGGTNYHELYLDYINEENKGEFICSYADDYEMTMDGHTVTATIGRRFNKFKRP